MDPMEPTEITIPAYSEVQGETITLMAPPNWHETIKSLTTHTVYGPNYLRAVVYSLERMSDAIENKYTSGAFDWLCNATDLAAYRRQVLALNN
jgi:hypothetical protein